MLDLFFSRNGEPAGQPKHRVCSSAPMIALAASMTMLAPQAMADSHETVDSLKEKIAGMEKQLDWVTKDRDGLAEQLMSTIEEVEALESDMESIVNGRTYIEGLLEKEKERAAARETELLAEIEDINASRDFISDRLETLHGESKAAASSAKEQQQNLATMQQNLQTAINQRDHMESQLSNSRAETASLLQQLETASAQLEDARQQMTRQSRSQAASAGTAQQTIATLQQDLQSVINGRDYMEEMLNSSRTETAAALMQLEKVSGQLEQARQQAGEQSQQQSNAAAEAQQTIAKLQQDLESTINGRDYIENLLKNSQTEAAAAMQQLESTTTELQAANEKIRSLSESGSKQDSDAQQTIARLQEDLQSTVNGRDYIENLLNESKKETTAAQQQLAAVTAELDNARKEIGQLSQTAGWATFLSQSLNSRLGDVEEISVTDTPNNKVRIQISNAGLFDVGATGISRVGRNMLNRVGKALAAEPDTRILVLGHTDNVPVGEGSVYANNMELSARRASNAMEYLSEAADIPLTRMSATGMGDSKPIASNATREGRSLNRRIELELSPVE